MNFTTAHSPFGFKNHFVKGLISRKIIISVSQNNLFHGTDELVKQLIKTWESSEKHSSFVIHISPSTSKNQCAQPIEGLTCWTASQAIKTSPWLRLLMFCWFHKKANFDIRVIGIGFESAPIASFFAQKGAHATLLTLEYARFAKPQDLTASIKGIQRILFPTRMARNDFRDHASRCPHLPPQLPELEYLFPAALPGHSQLSSKDRVESFKAKMDWRENAFVILGEGNSKDFQGFAAIGELLFKENPDAHVRFVWVTRTSEEVPEVVQRWPRVPNHWLSISGPVDDPSIWLAAAHVFVITSNSDCFHPWAMPSMAQATPVMAFLKGSGVSLLLQENDGGIVLPERHWQAASDILMRWLENPIECENLGRTAQRFFQQHNSWDQYAGHIWKRLHNDFRGRRIISKHAKVKSILKNRDCFLHEFPHPDYRSPKSRLMMLSGGEHRERKKLIQEEFTPTRNKALAADWEIVFDRIAANLPENNREIDVIEQLFNPFLSLTIVKMLGLDPEKMSDYLTAAKLIPILIPPEVISFPHDEQMNEYH